MPDREAVMTAIYRVTKATANGPGRCGKFATHTTREAAAMRALFKAIGIDKPTEEEVNRCYPWA